MRLGYNNIHKYWICALALKSRDDTYFYLGLSQGIYKATVTKLFDLELK